MPAMVTLPDTVIDQLEERAAALQLSADELAVQLIRDGLRREPAPNGAASGRHPEPTASTEEDVLLKEEDFPTLEEVVAMIKATPPNPDAIYYGEKVGDLTYLQELIDNPPTNTITKEEWEREWWPIRAEMNQRDRLEDIPESKS